LTCGRAGYERYETFTIIRTHRRGYLRPHWGMASGVARSAPPAVEPHPGRHLAGPGTRLAQESHPRLSSLDDHGRSPGVDQYPYYPRDALLSPLHADWVVYAPARQGSHAAYLIIRGGELSCRAPATSLFAHAASILRSRKHAYERICR